MAARMLLITIRIFDSADEAFASNKKAADWVRNSALEFTKGMPVVMVGDALSRGQIAKPFTTGQRTDIGWRQRVSERRGCWRWHRQGVRLPRMSELPSSKHPAVDLTAPPENPELAIAMHFAETATERSTAELLWALPLLKGAMPRSGRQYDLVSAEIARRQQASAKPVGRKHL